MTTISVKLTDTELALLDSCIERGTLKSRSDALRKGLDLLIDKFGFLPIALTNAKKERRLHRARLTSRAVSKHMKHRREEGESLEAAAKRRSSKPKEV